MTIPKNIFQTHKSLKYVQSKPALLNAMKSWLRYKGDYKYHFFTNEMCDTFMREEIGGIVYQAYQRLPMGVMKADLWRYCIIYCYGGIYSDIDTVCLKHPSIFLHPTAELVLAPEIGTPYFCQWTFAAPPKSPILLHIINLSAKRILTIPKIKGEHIIHYLTGPALFTDAIEECIQEKGGIVYPDKKEYCKNASPSLYFFHPDLFHNTMIRHLFAGSDKDGWKNERYKKLV
jgi:inositol phosphorylceramide mannosyltransferase catalytic subunit